VPVLLTPRIRFLHVPKTGGTWAWRALQAAGVQVEAIGGDPPSPRTTHLDLSKTTEFADRFTIAFVRHPLDWWRSMWAYRMRTDWDGGRTREEVARSDDFNTFIERVIEHLPGQLETQFARYIGPPSAPIDYIGRYETLADDLVRALAMAGEELDEPALRAYPPDNVSDYERFPAAYRPELAERLAESEHVVIKRFYADDPVPRSLLAPRQSLRSQASTTIRAWRRRRA
jgi:hypothetical protein